MNQPLNNHYGMQRSESLNELAKALAQAQGEFTSAEREHVAKVVSKKGEGSSYSYNYADLASYLDVCRGPLAKCGLSFVQSSIVDGGNVFVSTLLLHESGQWIEFPPLGLHASDTTPQTIGSAITYARRYALSAALGMASEADDDANAANGNQADTAPREKLPACPKCGKTDSVIVGNAQYGAGLLCFAKKGGCGEKWETEEYKFNENHKGKKSNGAAKVEELETKAASLFDQAAKSIEEADQSHRKKWRERVLVRYGEGAISPAEMVKLSSKAVARIGDEEEADQVSKWLVDICNLGNDTMFDPVANELAKVRAEFAAA